MPAVTQRFLLILCMTVAACGPFVLHPRPVSCPPDVQAQTVDTSRPFHLDGPPPTNLFTGPYTVVVDERIVAGFRTYMDSMPAFGRSPDLDPTTIKAIEVIRMPAAQQRYPGAIGDVLRVTRCLAR
jgi:hypothetical protein